MYLFLDTETGGLDPQQHSLLEVYMCVTDSDLNIIEESHLHPRPRNGFYIIDPKALSINKFVPPRRLSDTEDSLYAFLRNYGRQEKLLPVGWNVAFDISFIKARYDAVLWDVYVQYHKFDLQVLADYFRITGKLDVENTRLETIAKHFGLIAEQSHTAKDDALLCIEVMKRFLTL